MEKKELIEFLKKQDELIKTIFISLLTSFITLGLFYFIKLKFIENFIPKYGFYLFFAILSYALILPTVKLVMSYKEFPCMTGMMIGMTIGMISGLLSGFLVGSTNGMFWGSIFGILVGIFFGTWNGRCCGIMGFMEGIMAGLMGGLMGSMTALMLLNDNLKAAVIVIFLISAVILVGLNVMIYNETKDAERKRNDEDTELFTIAISLILTFFTIFMMVFGPRSVLFR